MANTPQTLLVANRGEIALRVIRAARRLGIRTVAIASEDDTASLHVERADDVACLPGVGPSAYLSVDAIIAAARTAGADAIHPGYGFLSESADLAQACDDQGLTFVGPSAGTLKMFGDKAAARNLAHETSVPVLPGTTGDTSLERMQEFFSDQLSLDPRSAVVIKAIAGGGGRGVRVVHDPEALPRLFDVCRQEALSAFGSGALYVERLLTDAFHIEVQLVADQSGDVSHLWDRDCSVQRRHQKLIEVAPATRLDPARRREMFDAATRLASAAGLVGVATAEFLVTSQGDYYFLEVNPRLQVEHTVTEAVTGVDLVAAQIALAAGASLSELGLSQEQIAAPSGAAIQVRVNAETPQQDGSVAPSTGTVSEFAPPCGAGVRVETAVRSGSRLNSRFDSLLAKIIVHDPTGLPEARRIASEALGEMHVAGVKTNLAFQRAILESEAFADGSCDTGWVDRSTHELVAAAAGWAPTPRTPAAADPSPAEQRNGSASREDPRSVRSPIGGVVVAVEVEPSDCVQARTTLVVVEAMKMQHSIEATRAGSVDEVLVKVGDVVDEDGAVILLTPSDVVDESDTRELTIDASAHRDDVERLVKRHELTLDSGRPDAVARRHARGKRTARENIDDLTDGRALNEFGALAVAAQSARRSSEDLEVNTPADGLVTGLARVNADSFPSDRSTCAVLAYDYTVLAGTQGYWNHKKTDRLLDVAGRRKLPVVLFAEGGGGRPGDVDVPQVAGLDYPTFGALAALSSVVPTVGIASGRCFAGNAALLGACHVVIATEDSNIGMGGPAMIEGGGLGTFLPEEIGPIDVQSRNGVVDVSVADEKEAVAVAKKYLSYFQGSVPDFDVADQRLLRHLVPENRKRAYDVRRVIETLCDVGSVLELRSAFGAGMITALARIEGRSVGVVANNPSVLGGAIDADGADKAARFQQLCDAFGIPLLLLCDTPGFMVGPESERQATVRHFSRLFVMGSHLTVPVMTVVLRKAYGLGALGMSAGSFHSTSMTVTWPTGEFGPMGLEGGVQLGFRRELEAIEDPEARRSRYEELVEEAYARGSATNMARHLEVDAAIDPAETRTVIVENLLAGMPTPQAGWVNAERRAGVDTW